MIPGLKPLYLMLLMLGECPKMDMKNYHVLPAHFRTNPMHEELC